MVAKIRCINNTCNTFLVCILLCYTSRGSRSFKSCRQNLLSCFLLFSLFYVLRCVLLKNEGSINSLKFIVYSFLLRGYGLLLYSLGLCIYQSGHVVYLLTDQDIRFKI